MSTYHCYQCDQQVGLLHTGACCLCGNLVKRPKPAPRVPFHAWGGLLGFAITCFAIYELAQADGVLGWPGVVAFVVGPTLFGFAIADGHDSQALRPSLFALLRAVMRIRSNA